MWFRLEIVQMKYLLENIVKIMPHSLRVLY